VPPPEVFPDRGDRFAFDQNVGVVGIGRRDDRTAVN
jgi:hypothetical protein